MHSFFAPHSSFPLLRQVYHSIFKQDCPFFGHKKKKLSGVKRGADQDTTPEILAIRNPFTIAVKILNGVSINLDVGEETTVLELKNLIEDHEGIPHGQQRLIFAGLQFEDGKTMADYSINDGSLIHVTLKLRGC